MEFLVKKGSYIIDKRFAWGAIAIMILVAVVALVQNGFSSKIYWSCPEDSFMPCQNPFISPVGTCEIDDPVICSRDVLQPGESVGEPPSFFVKYGYLLDLFVLGVAALLNHFIHNGKRRSDE